MIRIECIDHLVLRSDRLSPMVDFYCGVLGCAVERRLPTETGLVQLRAGSALIDLVDVHSELGRRGGSAPHQTGRNLEHFCLQIAAVSAADLLQWLRLKGVEAGPFERRYGASGYAPSIYIQDPDGNVIELRIAGSEEP